MRVWGSVADLESSSFPRGDAVLGVRCSGRRVSIRHPVSPAPLCSALVPRLQHPASWWHQITKITSSAEAKAIGWGSVQVVLQSCELPPDSQCPSLGLSGQGWFWKGDLGCPGEERQEVSRR